VLGVRHAALARFLDGDRADRGSGLCTRGHGAFGPEDRGTLPGKGRAGRFAERAADAGKDALRRKTEAERELGRREADIERLRKSLEATRGDRRGPEAALVSRVLAAEDALVRLRERIDDLDGEIARHRQVVKAALAPLR